MARVTGDRFFWWLKMVATAEGRQTEEPSERAESPVQSGLTMIARRPAMHLLPERRRARRPRSAAEIRAMAVWPRLDRRVLARCQGETTCLARAIARHRTTMSVEHVIRILTGADAGADHGTDERPVGRTHARADE